MKILEYPAWHDEARKKIKLGQWVYADAMREYKMSSGRVTQLFGPKWKQYLIRDRTPTKDRQNLDYYTEHLDEYTFSPVDVQRIEPKKKYDTPLEEYDPMGKPRIFERARKVEDGISKIGAIVRCGHDGCTKTEEYYSGTSVNPTYLPMAFAKLGWSIGAGPRADRCPNHGFKHKAKTTTVSIEAGHTSNLVPPKDPIVLPELKPEVWEKVQTMEPAPMPTSFVDKIIDGITNAVKQKKEEPVNAPAIPQPDRATKRIIHNKLDDVYADEQTGYKGDWTDAKVATDLGVSVEWVQMIRSDSFGPELNAAIVSEKRGEIQATADNVERMIKLIDAKLDQMQALDKKLDEQTQEMQKLVTSIDAALARYQELTTNLKTLDTKNEDLVTAFTKDVADFRKLYSEFMAPEA